MGSLKYNSLVVVLLTSLLVYGQTPLNDQNWTIFFEDNFLSSGVDQAKWQYNPPWGNCTTDAHLTNNGDNHDFSNPGTIQLLSKQQSSVCTVWDGSTQNLNYTTGGLFSKDA